MDLSTTFMGLRLDSPLVAGASPLTDGIDVARRLEDAGAAAIVMRSLFMEQITRQQLELHQLEGHRESYAEATTYLAEPPDFALGPAEYLEQVAALKRTLGVPVIASLNGVRPGEWVRYASLIQQAGADGLELNVYHLPLDGDEPPEAVEQRYVDILAEAKSQATIPVAMKLTFFHSSPVWTCQRLDQAGASALVLFNRLYLPDIDVVELGINPRLHLSTPATLKLRLLWLAAAFGKVSASLAVTGGVHTATDVVKAVMAGADVAQMASALLRHGPDHVGVVKKELIAWMEENEYESVHQMRGSMSLERSPDPEAYERANYLRVLHTW